ncbi:hypothetical protein HDR62_01950 [bacterium]|nr:hypothetical protein [bacterium]
MGLLCLLLASAPETVVRLLGSSDRLLPHTMDYLLWLIPGIFFLLFESIGMMVIRLDGSPKYAMLCNVIPSVINIVLDWYFSYVLRFCWDLQGFFVNIWRQIRVGSSAVVTPKSW